MRRACCLAAMLVVGVIGSLAPAQTTAPAKVDLKYSFAASAAPGFTRVAENAVYTRDAGYGFDLESRASQENPAFTTGKSGRPFFFSATLAPGAYKVAVTLGSPTSGSETTIKSETRRLMAEAIQTKAGESRTVEFLVHIRVPQLPDGRMVRLKPREKDPILWVYWDKDHQVSFTELDWDEKLTLQFSGASPAVKSIEISNAVNPTTIYLVGDSTMTDQMMEPWNSWGQMFPRWFKPPVLIANYAESGESAASFISELRWAKLMSEIHAGDYVLIQFGINDRATPIDRFKQHCITFIDEAKAKGAIPILVTSQNLRRLDPDGKGVNTLGEYPQTMRDVAKEKNATLIDLNAISMKLYEGIGAADLPKAFVDGTHHNSYGSYQLAKCVAQAAIDLKLPWADHISADWKAFDAAKPDPVAEFKLPPDPQLDPSRPGGPGLPAGVPSATGGRAGAAASQPTTAPTAR